MQNYVRRLASTIAVLLTMCLTGYSQGSKIVVIGKDTFSLVPMRMVHQIIDTKLALMECDSLMSIGESMLNIKLQEVDYLTKIVQKQDDIIKNDSVIEAELKRDNQELVNVIEDAKKKDKRLRLQRDVLAGSTGVFGLAAALFAILKFK